MATTDGLSQGQIDTSKLSPTTPKLSLHKLLDIFHIFGRFDYFVRDYGW